MTSGQKLNELHSLFISLMASLPIQRLASALRSSPRTTHRFSFRSYAVLPAKPAWSPRTYVKPTAAAKVSTAPGIGNPETIESLPSNKSEFEVSSEVPPPNTESPANGNGNSAETPTDWSRSYHGLSEQAFSKDIADILLAPIDPLDIEMKPGKHRQLS